MSNISLIKKIEELKLNKQVSSKVNKRIKEFELKYHSSPKEWFSELCFCLLTANWKANPAIQIQKELGFNGFYDFSEEELYLFLKKKGHRFPMQRTKRIIIARQYYPEFKNILNNLNKDFKREWLVKNIVGLGYKEASHFLRNTGHKDYAIIDRHILNLMCEENLCIKPKTITKRRYLEIEIILDKLCQKVNLSQSELDLYLWFMKTNTILK